LKPATFEYHAAHSLDEAFELLARFGDEAKVLAGGQSLAPLLNMRLARPAALVDINPLTGLDTISADGTTITLGALVRLRAAERDREVRDRQPLLTEGLPWVGHRTIRNRGTVGGSLCHADPAAELPAIAVALGAEMVISSKRGSRTVPAADFFTGFFATVLEPDELLVECRWPPQEAGVGSAWVELALRHGDYALVGVAAVISADAAGVCRSAVLTCAGVAEKPALLIEATEGLVGQPLNEAAVAEACELAAVAIKPSSDLMASAAYKRRLVRVLGARALETAYRRATQGQK
jgi:carbon-monoxide dehydrogenase medium subunit